MKYTMSVIGVGCDLVKARSVELRAPNLKVGSVESGKVQKNVNLIDLEKCGDSP